MAKSKVSGSNGLNFTARLDINEAKRNALELKNIYKDLGITTATAQNGAFKVSQLAFQEQLKKSRLELAALKKEEQELRNGRVKTGAETAELTKKITENRLAQQELTKAAREAREEQKKVAGSYFEAQKRLTELGNKIKSTSIGYKGISPELRKQIRDYNELNDKLKRFDATMGNHQRNVGNYAKAVDGLKSMASSYAGGLSILAIGNQVLQANAKISDSLSDVRRTTGLTADEAENLANQLKKIDTRTSLAGLLEIATIGGQLGIAKDQLAGFTNAVNQLAVSLGSELQGGAEGIAKSLGVLDNIFSVTKNNSGDVEKSYNQIGSAILGLGQSGLATGDYLTDFGERVGGIAKQAGLSLPVILSYGAVLQESGVNAEVAGSSFNRLISALSTNRAKFFEVAKIADANLMLKQFTNIINTDTKKALDLFFAGLAKGGTTTTSFNDILAKLKLTGVGVSQGIAALAGHQQELNGHIVQATKDFDEATLAAEQYAIKNDNLAGSIEKLGNTFTNATTKGGIASFFKVIVDGLNNTLSAVNRLVNSASWKSFFIRVAGGLTGRGDVAATALDDISRYKNMTNIERELEFFREMTKERQKQKIIDQTIFRDKAYEQATGPAANNVLIDKYNKEQALLVALRKEYRGLAEDKKTVAGSPSETIPETSAKEKRALETALNAQRNLQAKIDKLKDKGKRKQLSDDEQEIEAVKAKYQKLRDEALRFNADPKNKAKGIKVDSSGLLRAESTETDALRDKQASEKLKITLDKQKKYYEEFEQYRVTYGEEKAKERYKNLIDTDKSYLQKLKEMEDDILNPEKSKGADNLYDGKSEKQLKELRESIEAETQAEQKKNDALLKEFMDYSQKRKVLIETYNRDYVNLANNPDEQAERTRRYNKELKELDDANGKKIDSYREMFTGIESLSRKSALKLLESARVDFAKQIKAGKIVDPKQIAEIKTYFNDVENTIRNGSGQALIDLARQVDNVASEVSKLDESFGKIVGTLGNVLGQLGNVKSGIASIKIAQGKGDIFGQLTSGLGIFGAGISIFQSIAGLFDKSAQREEQASYARDVQNKQTEALNKALERQIALLNDVYGTERIANYSEAIKQAQENQAKYSAQLTSKYSLSGNKQLDDIISKINNGEGTGVFGLSVDAFVKANQAALEKLKLPTDLQSLQTLLDEGKLDVNTSNIVTNLLKAKQTAEELVNSLRQEVVGTTLEEVADDFIKTLTDGTQDFGKTFEETMQKSILNGFKGELIRKQLQAFYTQFAELSEGGLTSKEIETLRASYLAASEKAKTDLEALSKATGIDLTNPSATPGSNSPSPITGVITSAGLTEDSANKAMGIWRGQYDQTKLVARNTLSIDANTLKIANSISAFYSSATGQLNDIVAHTKRTADNTDDIVPLLKKIDQNTSSSSSYNNLLGSGVKP